MKFHKDGIILTSDANENGLRLFEWINTYGTRAKDNESITTANERSDSHKNHASQRALSKGYDYLGVKGEEKYEQVFKEFGVTMDRSNRPQGDGGCDFLTIIGRVDIKTARKPRWLLVEVGKVLSDYFVLARYNDLTDDTTLIGYATRYEVIAAPAADKGGYGILSHYIQSSKLHSMKEHRELYETQEKD